MGPPHRKTVNDLLLAPSHLSFPGCSFTGAEGPWRERVALLSVCPGEGHLPDGMGCPRTTVPTRLARDGGAAEDGSPFTWNTFQSFSGSSHRLPSCSGPQPGPPELSAPRVQQRRCCLLMWEKGLRLQVWFCCSEGGG